jgi:hypothetical protein
VEQHNLLTLFFPFPSFFCFSFSNKNGVGRRFSLCGDGTALPRVERVARGRKGKEQEKEERGKAETNFKLEFYYASEGSAAARPPENSRGVRARPAEGVCAAGARPVSPRWWWSGRYPVSATRDSSAREHSRSE